ncbi:MAG: hypothetical protein CMP28_13550 [Roseibacillus sp.]|nr:hypothetical protein [Roseibacillus sp.]
MSRFFPLLTVFTLSTTSLVRAEWRQDTVFIQRKDDTTVARHPGNDAILFSHADPQLAIEWGLRNVTNTVVLGGTYTVSDRIDIPRPGVTLIIDREAILRLNPEGRHTTIDFRSRNPGYWQILPMIYNKGHDDVRVLLFGTIEKWKVENEDNGKQTLPIMFDGRNEQGTCGLSGGLLMVTGHATDSFWLVDAERVRVPVVALDTNPLASLVLEGCEDCHLGLIASIAPEQGGNTEETIDLNSRNIDITIERLVGERSQEIIDCNESHVVVQDVVSIGRPRKMFGRGPASGPRYTDRRPFGSRSLDVRNTSILHDAMSSRLVHEVPELPGALPSFTVQTTVEVTLRNNRRKHYQRSAHFDLRGKPAGRGGR